MQSHPPLRQQRRRELEEETAHRAAKWERLGGFYSAPGFLTEYLTIFLATDLAPAGDDRLAGVRRPHRRGRAAPARALLGRVNLPGIVEDSKSVAGILLLARRLEAMP